MASAGSVILAFDDALARDAVALACRAAGLQIVASGRDSTWLLGAHERWPDPTIVVGTDLHDGPVEGCVARLCAGGADVVVLSDDLSPDRFIGLLERGVTGHLRFSASLGQLADAITAVGGGGAALDPADAAVLLTQWRRLRSVPHLRRGTREASTLTARELDVVEAMVDGLTTKGIARHLGLATKTVENHKVRIFDKLGVRNQAEAVAFAIAEGLLTMRMTAPAMRS